MAKWTIKIRYWQKEMDEHPEYKETKSYKVTRLKEMIEKRTKFLNYLRRWDYKCFEWILEKLDLEYKPQPEQFAMIARKEGLRQLTRSHCDEIRDKRLDEYRESLEAQQLPFLEKKLSNLEFIRNEQIELGVEVTVSLQQIDEVRQQYDEMKEKRKDLVKVDDNTKKWKVY